jgi:prepilin-type N-terminal cleavage/methylation domain-containing protein
MISTYQRLKRRRETGETDGGFTLIELLIVIVVLGILAAVVVFSLGGITSKSAVAACQSDGATLTTSMAAYNALNGSNPTNDAAMVGATGEIQAWPDNVPNYAYGIVSGVLYIDTTVTGMAAWNTTPTTTGAVIYTGPSQCSAVT